MSDTRIKLHWVTQDGGSAAVANALGYNQHNAAMKKHCEKYFEYDDNAQIAITITPADQFTPVPGKFNILFTMWECIDVPKTYIPGLNSADLIIVPSQFCYDIFKPLTTKPIKICPEGVDPKVFTFKERTLPSNGQKFRFLWLGAPNPRKGYYTIIEFAKVVEHMPNFELYVKTTSGKKLSGRDVLKTIWKRFSSIMCTPHAATRRKEWASMIAAIKRYIKPEVADRVMAMGKYNNVIFDSRKLPMNELIDLYHSAHCFLIPHCGEGWCLPLCEAMATGCPSIASDSTSVKDFFDKEVGYPVKCDIGEADLQNYELKARMYIPDTEDFIKQAITVVQGYKEALRRAKKASYRIRTKFTWEKAAARLNEIVQTYAQGE